MSNIYMDNAATTKLRDCALDTMRYALYANWYNPSSPYSQARKCRNDLESCRCQIAELINADPSEIYFTSGGTESDNWALKGTNMSRGDNVIISAIEHDAVYRTAKDIGAYGVEVRMAFPNYDGYVEPQFILDKVDDKTKLVSCMYINNETGVIQPIPQLGEQLRKQGVLFHTDAVQAFGHIPIDVAKLKVDMLSVSAHKFGGPKGVGFLFVRNMTKLKKLVNGGHQEADMRSGTENLPAIMGMAAAAREAVKNMESSYLKIVDISSYITEQLSDIDNSIVNGYAETQYWGIMNFSFMGVPSEQLVEFLNEHDICVSSGSACNTGSELPSRTLIAMNRTEDEANCAIRLSINEDNTIEEAIKVVDTIKKGVELIRG